MTYIRRKVFSLLHDENGEERYFSTTEFEIENDIDERYFSDSEKKKDKKTAEKAALATAGVAGLGAAAGETVRRVVKKKAKQAAKKAAKKELINSLGVVVGGGLANAGILKHDKWMRLVGLGTYAGSAGKGIHDRIKSSKEIKKLANIEKYAKHGRNIAGGLAAAGLATYGGIKAAKAIKKHKESKKED